MKLDGEKVMQRYEVIFYDMPDGTEPAKEFLLSLDRKMLAKMLKEIDLLEVNGPAVREPYSKSVGDGIFELRAKVGSDITRILYFFFVGHKIILTNGFVKKSNKTPANELERAKKYRDEFIRRQNHNDEV